MFNLNRFINAQDLHHNVALEEIKSGKKKSHWIWYIFPQLKGLGSSYYSDYYGIESIDEAKEYVANSYLYGNLRKITEELLKVNTTSINDIMDNPDDLKLRSSMTLFYIATNDELFKEVLDKYFNGQMDQKTINLLQEEK